MPLPERKPNSPHQALAEIAAWPAFLKYLILTLDGHTTTAKLSAARESFLKYPDNGLEKVTQNFVPGKFSPLVPEFLQELSKTLHSYKHLEILKLLQS